MTNQKSKRTISEHIKMMPQQFEFSVAVVFCPNAVFDYYTLPFNENVRHVWEESSAIHGHVLRFGQWVISP